MINTAIFDIDGTLVDSVDLHAQAWREAFRHFGKEVEFTAVRQQIGKGGDQLIKVFLSKKEIDDFGDELEEFRKKFFQHHCLHRVEPFPQVRELFQRIQQDEKKIVLATSAPEDELEFYKKLLQIEDLLEDETSADDVDKSKPHPDIFLAALEKADEENPAKAIVIGDSPHDVSAASKIKLKIIGLLCGGFSKEQLKGCIALYRDPEDLLLRYENSPLASKVASFVG